MRLTSEREKEIRDNLKHYPHETELYLGSRDLLAEIDVLRDEIFVDLLAEVDALREDARIWEEKAFLWMTECDALKAKYILPFGSYE